jgi:hypothetical protein
MRVPFRDGYCFVTIFDSDDGMGHFARICDTRDNVLHTTEVCNDPSEVCEIAHVILTEILAVGKHENGSVIRFLGCLSQSLEKHPQRGAMTVATVYAPMPPLLPLVDVCTVATLGL